MWHIYADISEPVIPFRVPTLSIASVKTLKSIHLKPLLAVTSENMSTPLASPLEVLYTCPSCNILRHALASIIPLVGWVMPRKVGAERAQNTSKASLIFILLGATAGIKLKLRNKYARNAKH
jgi:hypothetical protein